MDNANQALQALQLVLEHQRREAKLRAALESIADRCADHLRIYADRFVADIRKQALDALKGGE